MYWNAVIETMPREKLRDLQLDRLKAVLPNIARVPFYTESFRQAGLSTDDLKTLDDLQKFPFTRKSDLRDNYPFGLFARPLNEVARIHGSSATKGKPTIVCCPRNDLGPWA